MYVYIYINENIYLHTQKKTLQGYLILTISHIKRLKTTVIGENATHQDQIVSDTEHTNRTMPATIGRPTHVYKCRSRVVVCSVRALRN